MRETRPKYSELTPIQRLKAIARSIANAALRRGRIQRKPCEFCGCKKAQMHHPDYHRPLIIVWVCRKCHLTLHRIVEAHA